jgi:peptide-methionine (S)-S-oxide reductase
MSGFMDNLDSLFQMAVAAIDAGDVGALERLLNANPQLVRDRLRAPGNWLRDLVDGALEGYFREPYLLWFIAENPIRNDKLPPNIAEVTQAIIAKARRENVVEIQEQLDYTLELVCTGRVARECGVQIELIDLLIDAGGKVGSLNGTLAHHELAAAKRLIERGAELTLTAAICLERGDDVQRLLPKASAEERKTALAAAAVYGNADMLALLINDSHDLDISAYAPAGFHAHATPLHHAVGSGSLEAVKVLVQAGADLGLKDKIYDCTPLDWAEYLKRADIVAYLRETSAKR